VEWWIGFGKGTRNVVEKGISASIKLGKEKKKEWKWWRLFFGEGIF